MTQRDHLFIVGEGTERERKKERDFERRNRVRYLSKLMSNPLNKGNGTGY